MGLPHKYLSRFATHYTDSFATRSSLRLRRDQLQIAEADGFAAGVSRALDPLLECAVLLADSFEIETIGGSRVPLCHLYLNLDVQPVRIRVVRQAAIQYRNLLFARREGDREIAAACGIQIFREDLFDKCGRQKTQREHQQLHWRPGKLLAQRKPMVSLRSFCRAQLRYEQVRN